MKHVTIQQRRTGIDRKRLNKTAEKNKQINREKMDKDAENETGEYGEN